MEFNPLSLLEVTMGNDAPKTQEQDEDCFIIEDDDSLPVVQVNDGSPMEPASEIFADAGIHFLQQPDEQAEDPLAIEPRSRMKMLTKTWIAKNITSLSMISSAEADYRKTYYKDLHDVLNERLHCTICQDHIGCDIRIHPQAVEHPILKVLTCQKCVLSYNATNFLVNELKQEMVCRWCAGLCPNSMVLRHCQQCPFAFCETCLLRNFQTGQPRNLPWTCLVCNMIQLWPARRTLWALQTLTNHFLSRPSTSFASEGDLSKCCAGKQRKRSNVKNQRKHQLVRIVDNNQNNNNNVNKVNTNYLMASDQLRFLTLPQLSELTTNTKLPIPANRTMPKLAPMRVAQLKGNNLGEEILSLPISCQNVEQIVSETVEDSTQPIDMKWLRDKIDGYISDVTNIQIKLNSLKNDLLPTEPLENAEKLIKKLTTVLSLNSNLFRDCSLNLMNEWREKKSRHALDKMQMITFPKEFKQSPKQSNSILTNGIVSVTKPKTPLNRVSSAGKITKHPTKTNTPLKVKMFNHVNKKPVDSITSEEKLKLLRQRYNIKDCEVIVYRLRPDFELKEIIHRTMQ